MRPLNEYLSASRPQHARHRYITRRQEHLEEHFEHLKKYVAPHEAMQVMVDAEMNVYSNGSEEKKTLHCFAAYMEEQGLHPLDVSVKAKVRYVNVYNAMNGVPITLDHAQQIRQAVFVLTGIPFDGHFIVAQPESINELPTLQIEPSLKKTFYRKVWNQSMSHYD